MDRFDPITLEILWNRCRTILNEEIAGLIRAAFSPIIREAKDCSAGLYDRAGNFMTTPTRESVTSGRRSSASWKSSPPTSSSRVTS